MYWIAFNTSRKSTSIRRPAFDARGRKGSIRAHSSSVKSLGYRLAFFSILAIRPRVARVHIPSLNHRRKPHSTTFQTVSQVHQNALTLDPRDDIGMGQQRFDESPPNGSVLGELRLVEIEADDHVAFCGVGQRLDDLRIGEDISGHVDGQFGAANLLNVDALKIFSRSIMDLDLSSTLRP